MLRDLEFVLYPPLLGPQPGHPGPDFLHLVAQAPHVGPVLLLLPPRLPPGLEPLIPLLPSPALIPPQPLQLLALLVKLLQGPLAPLKSVNLRDQLPLVRKLEVAPGQLGLQPLNLEFIIYFSSQKVIKWTKE